MRDNLESRIVEYVRSNDYNDNTLNEIVQEAQSLSIYETIEMANSLILLEPTSSILLEAYRGSNLSDNLLEEHHQLAEAVYEHLVEHNHGSLEYVNIVRECLQALETTKTMRNTDVYLYETTKEHFTKVLHDMDKTIVLEGANIEWNEDIALETALARTQAEFDLAFTEFSMGPDDLDSLTESAVDLIRLSNRYDKLLLDFYDVALEADHHTEVKKNGTVISSSQSTAKKTALKVDKSARKASGKLRKGSSDAKSVGNIAAKAAGRFTSLITNTVGKLDKLNKEERMDAILQGGMRKRVSTVIRTAITTGAATAINPALGLITLLTTSALRKGSDDRLKREVMSEYEGELKMVREKIRDAEASGDRKGKYELMRIETHLEQNIERIKSPTRMNKPKLKKG